MLKLVFLLFGVLTLVGIVWHIGLDPIIETTTQLGPFALLMISLPMIGVYLLEALGWRLTLGEHAGLIGFVRLFAIRMAGESINVTTPSAYVGGEPMKAYLLKRYGVPMVEGLASVITAKTTMTIAQILFILLGMGLAFWILGSSEYHLLAMLMSIGLLLFGVVLFLVVQRYGISSGLLYLLRLCRIRIGFLEARESKLLELDQVIRDFYTHRRRTFLLATGTFFLGWMTETLEVYAILYYLGVEVDLLVSVSIAALTVLIKGGTFFIPGSVGAQEGGYVLLLLGYGYTDVAGITFALIRRLREVLWIIVGLIFLAALRAKNDDR